MAKFIDDFTLVKQIPDVTKDSVETLLSLLAASMLVIATFSVASMVSAYSAASTTATPRSFTLVIADDVSQNALSTFVGAFIFSVVALTAVKNAFYDKGGLFVLFIFTIIVFAMVIVTFVRWVDSIARLGRIGSTIDTVEKATKTALLRRQFIPLLGGGAVSDTSSQGQPVFTSEVGYVQHIDMSSLQSWADKVDAQVTIAALPGTFTSPNQVLAYVNLTTSELSKVSVNELIKCFKIGRDRTFEDDPRFGMIALSEIAARALSPAVNDPGTAIKVIGSLVRLISLLNDPKKQKRPPEYNRIAVPEIMMADLFDDAFTAIARDGAGTIEVCVRLQKALNSLESLNNVDIRKAAQYHKDLSLKRAYKALDLDEDLETVKKASNVTQIDLNQYKRK